MPPVSLFAIAYKNKSYHLKPHLGGFTVAQIGTEVDIRSYMDVVFFFFELSVKLNL